MSMSDQLRAAIRNAESLAEIEEATGINHSVLKRFVDGERDLRLATAEKLLVYFRMTVSPAKG